MANGANWFAQRLFECFGTQSLHIEYAKLVSYSGANQTELQLVSMPQKTDVENVLKSLGYRSKDLIIQTSLSFMPSIIISVVVFSIISYLFANTYMSFII